MPARAQNSITIALTCVMAILLCLVQTASAVAAKSPEKTASGNFFGPSDIYTGEILPESLQPHWEIDPATTPTASGRQVWLSPDPLGEAGGINLYGYVGNDPVNRWDPLGLKFLTWGDSDGDDWFPSLGEMGENMAQFSMGMADNLSFGLNGVAREAMYGDDYSDKCSNAYKGGEWTGTGVSLAMGGAGAAKGLAKAGSSSLRKQLYEIGQKTLTNRSFRHFASRNANPVRRGIDIVRQQGWIRASLPSPMGLLTQGWKTGTTTGLTPLAAESLGAAAATGYGVASTSYNSFKPSGCQ